MSECRDNEGHAGWLLCPTHNRVVIGRLEVITQRQAPTEPRSEPEVGPHGVDPAGCPAFHDHCHCPELGTHPASYVEEEMRERGWDRERLALEMTRREYSINLLALETYLECAPDDRVILGPTMAQQFGEAFGTSAEFWLNLEKAWRKSLAPREVKP